MTETLNGRQVLALLAQDEPPEIEVCAWNDWKELVVRNWSIDDLRTTGIRFRIKPTPQRRLSVTLANGEVVSWPEPVRETLVDDQEYFFADSEYQFGVNDWHWSNYELDGIRMKLGLIHLTREAAQEHADALLKINCQEVGK